MVSLSLKIWPKVFMFQMNVNYVSGISKMRSHSLHGVVQLKHLCLNLVLFDYCCTVYWVQLLKGKIAACNELILVEPSSCCLLSPRPLALYLASLPFSLSQLSILYICIPSICAHNFVVNALNKCCCYVVMEKVRTIPLPKSNASWIHASTFHIHADVHEVIILINFHSWLCGGERKWKSKWSHLCHCWNK